MLPTVPELKRRRERMNLDRIHEISRGLSPFAREINAHFKTRARVPRSREPG